MKNRRILRYVAIFLLGLIAGGAAILILHGRQLEQLMIINRNLTLLYERKVEEIASLKKERTAEKEKREDRIEEIRVTLLDPKPNEIIATEIVNRLEKDMAALKEKKVDQVAEFQPLLHELLKKRTYKLDGKNVEVQLKTVVISRVTQLFVNTRVDLVNSTSQ